MKPKVVIYTTKSCPYCVRAKDLMKSRGVAFEEVQFGWDDDAQWDALQKKSGMMSVPQIFERNGESGTEEKLIGGFQELSELDRSRGLDHLK